MTTELEQVPILDLPITEVTPSIENRLLYDRINRNSPEMRKLARSVQKFGILEPLVVTADPEHYIISGHRRYAAADMAHLSTIPCRIENVYKDQDRDKFLELLGNYNYQRVKTFSESLREEIAAVDPDLAHRALIRHRERQRKVKVQAITLTARKYRAEISPAKFPMLRAIQQVIEERREFWPLTDRQIHYALLNNPPLIHASKPDSTYRNNPQSYKALTDLLTRARLERQIPFEVIGDETRPIVTNQAFRTCADFIRTELHNLFRGYWRNLQQSQPRHIELFCEKNTVASILRPIAEEFTIPITSGRGFCSLPPRHDLAERYRKSGKNGLVVLLVSDFDPPGEVIAESFSRSLRDDFNAVPIQAIKVALTYEQVQQYKLPPLMVAKKGCATRKSFVEKYGEYVYELEALEPAELQKICRCTIEKVLDRKMFDAEYAQERLDTSELEIERRKILALMKNR